MLDTFTYINSLSTTEGESIFPAFHTGAKEALRRVFPGNMEQSVFSAAGLYTTQTHEGVRFNIYDLTTFYDRE